MEEENGTGFTMVCTVVREGEQHIEIKEFIKDIIESPSGDPDKPRGGPAPRPGLRNRLEEARDRARWTQRHKRLKNS